MSYLRPIWPNLDTKFDTPDLQTSTYCTAMDVTFTLSMCHIWHVIIHVYSIEMSQFPLNSHNLLNLVVIVDENLILFNCYICYICSRLLKVDFHRIFNYFTFMSQLPQYPLLLNLGITIATMFTLIQFDCHCCHSI